MKKSLQQSFGVIPIRDKDSHCQVLLVLHQKGHWGFPKGKPEQKETPKETAIRELKEETGLDVIKFLGSSFQENYYFEEDELAINKQVVYFPALVEGEVVLQEEEVSEASWMGISQAEETMTFLEGKKMLQEVKEWLQSQLSNS
jgi:bis(5'-nucleosidyl)-tetraphosphatase